MNAITTINSTAPAPINQVSEDLYQRYLAYVDVSPVSASAYRRNLKQLFQYFLSNGIKQPQRHDILNYRSYLQDEKGLKATSIQAYMNAVRLFFRWTEQEGLYPNIADRVKSVKVSKEPVKTYLKPEQMRDVLGTVTGTSERELRDYAMMVLMVSCGLRTIEVVRANVEDLKPVGNTVMLFVEGKGMKGNKTGVKVPAEAMKPLSRYLQKRKAKDSEPLFTSLSRNNAGNRMTTRAVSGICKEHMKQAGIESPFLTAHSFRHTAVTWAIQSGDDLLTVQEFARHGKPETTMIYVHALKKEKNPCSEHIARMLFA